MEAAPAGAAEAGREMGLPVGLIETYMQRFELTKDQVLEQKAVFDEVDQDKSGTISKEELEGCLEQMSEDYYDADEQWKELDVNGDGKVDFQEFLKVYVKCALDRDVLIRSVGEDGIVKDLSYEPTRSQLLRKKTMESVVEELSEEDEEEDDESDEDGTCSGEDAAVNRAPREAPALGRDEDGAFELRISQKDTAGSGCLSPMDGEASQLYTVHYYDGFWGRAMGIVLLLDYTKQPRVLKTYEGPKGAAGVGLACPLVTFPDGITMSQTPGILETLGEVLDLEGATFAEKARTKQLLLDASDMANEILAKRFADEARAGRWGAHLESKLETGFFVGRGLTAADFGFVFAFAVLDALAARGDAKPLEGFPRVVAWWAMMRSLPEFKAMTAQRPLLQG